MRKELSKFSTNKRGHTSDCKKCRAEYQFDRRIANPSKYAIAQRKFREENPDKQKDYDLKRSYGIGIVDYIVMLKEQNGLCAICKKPETSIRKNKVMQLAVDHCHETGKIRSLLCSKCNPGIGYFNHDINLLKSAIDYLENMS